MDDLYKNPLLQRSAVHKMVSEIPDEMVEKEGSALFPVANTDDDQVRIDRKMSASGMTVAVADGAESPLVPISGIQQDEYAPLRFREKHAFVPRDLRSIRKLGTASEKEKAAKIILNALMELKGRSYRRVEWCRWSALMNNSIIVNENGVIYQYNLNIPADMRPVLTGATVWSNANSTPVNDLINWFRLFRATGITPYRIWMNYTVQALLMNNAQVRALINTVITGGTPAMIMSPAALEAVIKSFLPNTELKYYDEGVLYQTKLTAALAAGATAMTVQSFNFMQAGDQVRLVAANGSTQEVVTIGATPTTNTVAISAATNAYGVSDYVREFEPYIHDDKILIEGALPRGAEGGQSLGEFISTPAEYNPGTIQDPKSGFFGEIQVHDDNADPKRVEAICGIYGLPVLYYPRGVVVATVN